MTSFNPNTLIITGGAGFIGSCFVSQMVELGKKVIVLDALTYAGNIANLEWIPQSSGTWELVQGSITDSKLVAELFDKYQPDAFVNFAAESHVDNSITGPAAFIDTNIQGTYVLLEAARSYWNNLDSDKQNSFRYLQISTDEIYGSLELDSDEKFSEMSQIKPRSPYSASKAAGDHLVKAWHETYGLPTITTNCTNNYGPRQHPEKLIPRMISCALAGDKLPVYGDGRNVRDWIHVEDHCRGIYLALTKGEIGDNYCFGGNAEKPNLEVVHTICDALNELAQSKEIDDYRELITFVKDRPGHDRRYAMDDSKAIKKLGYTRDYTFESGIKQTIEWYLDNEKWRRKIQERQQAA